MSGVSRGSTKCTGDSIEMRRPAKPGDPDDEVEGVRVEAVKMAMSKELRGIEESLGKVVNEEH